jgi:predicted outer membrane protein
MKKIILVGLAILAVSTSAALAKSHAKPKAPAAATSTGSAGPLMGQVSAADLALYKKNKHDSGVK